jgi:two-component system phosphate regulon response regulator PhoB
MIYLVEDHDDIRETVKSYLELAGYPVLAFGSAAGVLDAMRFKEPSICVFDVMLPDGNGFALAKEARRLHPRAGIIFLTAREAESDRVTGFELGADDYVTKPFSPRELVLRVQALDRRLSAARGGSPGGAPGKAEWELHGHRLSIDEAAHLILHDGIPVQLTPAEWSILTHLAAHAGIVISRDKILGACLDYAHDGSERTVNTHLKNIRAKLGGVEWIETVRGFGYKFMGARP